MSTEHTNANLTSQSDNRAYKTAGFVLLFFIFSTIVFVFVKTLGFDQPISDQALKQALVVASVGVTLSCLIAWVLDLLQIIDLRPGWSKLLWAVIVTSILGSSAAAYKQFAQGNDAMNVACVRALAIDASTGRIADPVAIVNQETLKANGTFGFLITLRNVHTDANGDYSIVTRWEFDEGMRAAFRESPYAGNAKRLRTDPVRIRRLEQYKKVMPECLGGEMLEVQVLSSLQPPTDERTGIHPLNITVYDKATGRYAQATLPTTLLK